MLLYFYMILYECLFDTNSYHPHPTPTDVLNNISFYSQSSWLRVVAALATRTCRHGTYRIETVGHNTPWVSEIEGESECERWGWVCECECVQVEVKLPVDLRVLDLSEMAEISYFNFQMVFPPRGLQSTQNSVNPFANTQTTLTK